jgi:hypothetical protein
LPKRSPACYSEGSERHGEGDKLVDRATPNERNRAARERKDRNDDAEQPNNLPSRHSDPRSRPRDPERQQRKRERP